MTHGRVLLAVRALFVVAVLGFAWWGLHSHADEIAAAASGVPPAMIAASAAATFLAVFCAGPVWRRLMTCYGVDVPARDGYRVFFVGQLGKYIPGSLWALGAQAQLAIRYNARPRVTVTAGLLLIAWFGASALAAAGPALAGTGTVTGWPALALVVTALLSLVVFVPPVVTVLGRVLAKQKPHFTWASTFWSLSILTGSWAANGTATCLLLHGRVPWLVCVGAFALAYTAGLVIPLAPAGLGARDAVLIAILTPTAGLAATAATAILLRVLVTVADFMMAGGWWLLERAAPTETALPDAPPLRDTSHA